MIPGEYRVRGNYFGPASDQDGTFRGVVDFVGDEFSGVMYDNGGSQRRAVIGSLGRGGEIRFFKFSPMSSLMHTLVYAGLRQAEGRNRWDVSWAPLELEDAALLFSRHPLLTDALLSASDDDARKLLGHERLVVARQFSGALAEGLWDLAPNGGQLVMRRSSSPYD